MRRSLHGRSRGRRSRAASSLGEVSSRTWCPVRSCSQTRCFVLDGAGAAQHCILAAFDRSAAHRQAPGMALAYERLPKLEDRRSQKKAGMQCDRSNAVINAAKTILACCGANAAFCGVHFLGMQGMHGARIRWPAGDPSKWSATHERLTRPCPVRRKPH